MLADPEIARRYAEWRDEIFEPESDRLRELRIPDSGNPIPEIEIQARWFAGEFGRKFSSPDGESIEVIQFGHWNRSAGPDFTEAAVRIEGRTRIGAIEIDLKDLSWESHGHGANPAFDEVVLHVFLESENPDAPRFHTRNSQHRRVVQVELSRAMVLAATRSSPRRHPPEARCGRCATPLATMAEADLESLLLAAARHRLHRKSLRYHAIAEAHSEDQALFQSSAEALGYRHNQLTMAILAQRLPLATLARHSPIEREALLFGVAGFLDQGAHFEAVKDPMARDYLKSLWDHWWKHRASHEPDSHRRLSWKLSGTRPTNHPQRRVAALATLVNDWLRFRREFAAGANPASASGAWSKALRARLEGYQHDYWSQHYTLKATPSDKPLALIGRDRGQDLLGNVLFPAAIPGRPELWDEYLRMPGSAISEPLRRAGLRLFGDHHGELPPRAIQWSRRYWQQQALLQIYSDFCLEDASECAECPFPEQLGQWQAAF